MPDNQPITLNVIAPLLIGDPNNLDSQESLAAWSEFAAQLAQIKALGAHAVAVDCWWGLIEPTEGNFSWHYYDRVLDCIVKAKLKCAWILSFHQCGGNIGDDVNIPIPSYIWDKIAKLSGRPASDFMYVSESGKLDNECISPWAAPLVLADKVRVMIAFQEHFAYRKEHIAEVTVGLGPASELRYPSYRDVPYPQRGELQCFSPEAVKSFRRWALAKYGDINGVAAAWNNKTLTNDADIRPPSDSERFFRLQHHLTLQYGWDFFDWYGDTLIAQGERDMRAAIAVFACEGAPFAGIDLGAKMSGVHWRIGRRLGKWLSLSDRLAEVPAGLIRTSLGDWRCECSGMGYRPYLMLFQRLQQASARSRIVLHFTCLEMPDGQDGGKAKSMAYSLVDWVGRQARQLGITIKGENALARTLPTQESWQRMLSHLALPPYTGAYEGLTILRMGDVLASDATRAEFARIAKLIADQQSGGGAAAEPQAA